MISSRAIEEKRPQSAAFPVSRYACLLRYRDKVMQFSRQPTWQPRNQKISKKSRRIFLGTALSLIDGKTAYQKILNQKNYEFRVLGDHKTYTSVDHLNHVNSFHSRIDEWNRKYRGVAAKYINRYSALLITIRKYAGLASDEVLLMVRTMLNNVTDFFRICDMKTSDIFAY